MSMLDDWWEDCVAIAERLATMPIPGDKMSVIRMLTYDGKQLDIVPPAIRRSDTAETKERLIECLCTIAIAADAMAVTVIAAGPTGVEHGAVLQVSQSERTATGIRRRCINRAFHPERAGKDRLGDPIDYALGHADVAILYRHRPSAELRDKARQVLNLLTPDSPFAEMAATVH